MPSPEVGEVVQVAADVTMRRIAELVLMETGCVVVDVSLETAEQAIRVRDRNNDHRLLDALEMQWVCEGLRRNPNDPKVVKYETEQLLRRAGAMFAEDEKIAQEYYDEILATGPDDLPDAA